ncbi:MAG: NAD(P)-binding protein [Candidatus Woesearchaeota archaeon]
MIYIIGAGPVGCYAAYLLAKKRNVRVFEEHAEIGKPVQCTGIVANDILNFIPENNKTIIRRLNKAVIYSPTGNSLDINIKKPEIIIDREKFDKYFYTKAKSRRSKIRFYLNHKLLKITERSMVFKKENGKTVSFPLKKKDIVIGADGPGSLVTKLINEKTRRKQKFFIGWQYVLNVKHNNHVEFFPEKKKISWVVPETDKTARVGIFGRKIKKPDFEPFLKKLYPEYENKIISTQGGLIPIYDPKLKVFRHIKNKRRDLRLYSIGDAASFVKATTGGGIIPGLKSAKILKKCIINNLEFNKESKKALKKELMTHLTAYKIFSRMNKKDWDNLIDDLNSRQIKKLIGTISRENLRILAIKMLLKKPKLIRYVFKLIQ